MQKTHTLLITGAASGIGAGIASQLAEAGRHVIVSDLNLEAAEAVAAQIRAEGGSAEAVALDVTSQDSIDAALAAISRPIDVLVNNAGLQHVSPLEEFPIEKWDFLVQVMLVGVARLTRAVLPGMRERGFGRIVNIGSVHALVASPYKSAYVAAKHGIVGLTKVTALELATTGVTANAICPGWVLTPLVQKQIDARAEKDKISVEQATRELLSEKEPSQQFTTPEQLGAMAVFFCSDAAANVRGQAWAHDGGWTAQ